MLGKILELYSQPTAGHRVIRVAGYLYQFAILDVVQECASVWAILWASASYDFGITGMFGHDNSPMIIEP